MAYRTGRIAGGGGARGAPDLRTARSTAYPAGRPTQGRGLGKGGKSRKERAPDPDLAQITTEEMAELQSLVDQIEAKDARVAELNRKQVEEQIEFVEKEQRARKHNRQHAARVAAAKAEIDETAAAAEKALAAEQAREKSEKLAKWEAAVTEPGLLRDLAAADAQLNSREAEVRRLEQQLEERSAAELRHREAAARSDAAAAAVAEKTAAVRAEQRREEEREVGVDKALGLARSAREQEHARTGSVLAAEGKVLGEVSQAGQDRERMEGKVNSMANLVRTVAWITDHAPQLTICRTVDDAREIKFDGVKGQGKTLAPFQFTRVFEGEWCGVAPLLAHCITRPVNCLVVAGDPSMATLVLRTAAEGLLRAKHPEGSMAISAVEVAQGVQRDLLNTDADYHDGALRGGSGASHELYDSGEGVLALRDAVRFDDPAVAGALQLVERNAARRAAPHPPADGLVAVLSAGGTQLLVAVCTPAPERPGTDPHLLAGIGRLYNDTRGGRAMLRQSFIGRALVPVLGHHGVAAVVVGHIPSEPGPALGNLRALARVGEVDLCAR